MIESVAPARPTEPTTELMDAICERIADGESLRSICLNEDMPQRARFFRWMADPANKSFTDQYARAREASADADADDVGYFAEEVSVGRMDASAGRVAIDAKKWSAGQRQPKKYGMKQTLEHSGPGGAPIQYASLTREERRARIAELQERASGADGSGGD